METDGFKAELDDVTNGLCVKIRDFCTIVMIWRLLQGRIPKVRLRVIIVRSMDSVRDGQTRFSVPLQPDKGRL